MGKVARQTTESPHLVTLDQLRPFDLNPRVRRNPLYEDIKESIRQRGLDNPPQITQRPGESFFIIANGGNTRLAILNELWQETQNETYFTIYCLFRPWPESDNLLRGNLRCLIGHLAEGDLHGRLTFIERALGVAQAKALYEQEENAELSQNRLARKLREDGYPALQQHIGKMLQAIEFLLPHIPDTLYGGLGRPHIEKLLQLRNSAERLWLHYGKDRALTERFDDLFALSLSPFNGPVESFSHRHVQDELLGMMSQALGINYNLLALNTDAAEQKRQTLFGPPVEPEIVIAEPLTAATTKPVKKPIEPSVLTANPIATEHTEEPDPEANAYPNDTIPHSPLPQPEASSSQTIKPDAIWPIDPLFDYPESLMSTADRLAWEIACACGIEDLITPALPDTPLAGFELAELNDDASNEAKSCWQILSFLSGANDSDLTQPWRLLLLGNTTAPPCWPDDFVINLFRLIRTIRRLREKQQMEVSP